MVDIFAAVVDIETTGLSATHDVPLEIGVMLIDKDGRRINDFSTLVWEDTPDFQKGVSRGRGNPVVEPMHHESGLWEELYSPKFFKRTRVQADAALCTFLNDNEVAPGKVPMLGNSIGSLDRPFCLAHFPRFNEFLSYRNIDISSFKEMCKTHNPSLWERLEPIVGSKKDADHRVMGDIKACIREYCAYVDNFFFTED